MKIATSTPVVNRLIDELPRKQRDRLLAHCTPVHMTFGEVLCDSGSRVTHVYFPLTGFISLVTNVNGQQPIEIGMIGNEGVLGATLALGISITPLQGVVQGSGSALRITSSQFRRQLQETPALQTILDHYLYILIEQLAQTAACNCFHEVRARLARWLLMTHDRSAGDDFHLTHQFLAEMLGVRRSAVTIAAGELQQQQLIRYTRGQINVLSRRGLEKASCECYARTVKAYDRQLPVAAHGRAGKTGPRLSEVTVR